MQDWFNQCSYGKTLFEPQNNKIVIGAPVIGNCVTSTPSCTDKATWDIYNAVLNHSTSVLRLSFSDYKRVGIYMPVGSRCAWSGLAMLNCPRPPCAAWFMGTDVALQAHEFGHTMGLQHATANGAEYGDASDVMGQGNSIRCLNAVYSAMLGWSTPIAVLSTGMLLQQGQWQYYTLPAMQLASVNHVRIDQVAWDGMLHRTSMYVSFRARVGYDAGLLSMYNNRVSVHIVNAEDKSELVAVLQQDEVMQLAFRSESLPRIRVVRINWNRDALIGICLGGLSVCQVPVGPSPPMRVAKPPPLPRPLQSPPSPPAVLRRPSPPSPAPPVRWCGCRMQTIIQFVRWTSRN